MNKTLPIQPGSQSLYSVGADYINPSAAIEGLSNSATKEKVLVVSIHTNSPEFAEIQIHLLRKYMNTEFDFVIALDDVEGMKFLDLGRAGLDRSFDEVCTRYDVPLIRIPRWVHEDRSVLFPHTRESVAGDVTNLRAADGLQYVFSVLPWARYRTVLLLDADMFPIGPVKAPDLSQQSPLAVVLQRRSKRRREITYFWNGIFWLSSDAPLSHLLNFDCVSDKGLRADTGGQTFRLLEAYAALDLKVMAIRHLASGCWGPKDAELLGLDQKIQSWLENDYRRRKSGEFHAEMYDGQFLHYRGGSNWSLSDGAIELANRESFSRALLGL